MIRAIAAATGQSAQTLSAISRRAYNAPSSRQTDDRRDDICVLAHDVVDDMEALRQQQVGRNIGTDSDLVARMDRVRLQPSPPRSRASGYPPCPPASPPQGSREVSSWESVIPPGKLPFFNIPNQTPMWKPPPPSPPVSSGQISSSFLEQLDNHTLNSQMKRRGFSYNDATTREQNIDM